jgi:hypothetical protein
MNPGWCTVTSPGALINNNNQAGWRSVDDTASRAAMRYGSYGFRRQSWRWAFGWGWLFVFLEVR